MQHCQCNIARAAFSSFIHESVCAGVCVSWRSCLRLHLLHSPRRASRVPGGHQGIPGRQNGCGPSWQVSTLLWFIKSASFVSAAELAAMAYTCCCCKPVIASGFCIVKHRPVWHQPCIAWQPCPSADTRTFIPASSLTHSLTHSLTLQHTLACVMCSTITEQPSRVDGVHSTLSRLDQSEPCG